MSPALDPVAALTQRLTAVAPVVLGTSPEELSAAALLPQLVSAVQASGDPEHLWALLVALAGAMPREEDMRSASRALRTAARPSEAQVRLLDVAFELAANVEEPYELDVVVGAVIADVDFCARRDFHTGIQRVVRETLPRWAAHRDVLPVAWTDTYTSQRRLHSWEVPNVMAYRAGTVRARIPDEATRLVLPLRSVIILPEVPEPEASDCYAAIGQWTENRIVVVGYDMIPVVSADLRPGFEATRFTRYLNAVKHADLVAAISRSAKTEFAGFSSALVAQGLAGPSVSEVLLPAAPPDARTGAHVAESAGRRPRVVCIGTHDPHKNHSAVVHAAERLWKEGIDFELVFIGGLGFRGPDHLCFLEAQRAGRPVRYLGRVSDAQMTAELTNAAFTMFISLHEGYGLPVAESLACGTPVVTSSFGSLQEIAEGGGCLVVDPRDDDEVTTAMRGLLTDPTRLAELRGQIAVREARTWDQYADELWAAALEDAR